MPHSIIPVLTILALSGVCVVADFLLKRASELAQPFRSPQFAVCMLLYAASAYGWVYVFRHIKLATVGAFFSVVVVVMLALIGMVVFNESLSLQEAVGLTCAVVALTLLGRFS